MYKKDLALNDLLWLICHKTKPNCVDLYLISRDEKCNVAIFFLYLKIEF